MTEECEGRVRGRKEEEEEKSEKRKIHELSMKNVSRDVYREGPRSPVVPRRRGSGPASSQ
jgi:hypothetical protein